MNIVTLLDSLSTRFGIIREKLKVENSVNNLNLNVLLEDVFIKILNLVYDLNLKNSNLLKTNYVAVDAIDKDKKVIFQITSTYSKEKIVNTIKKLKKTEFSNEKYTLYFFFLKERKNLQQKSIDSINNLLNGNIQFDVKKNLIGDQDIYKQIYHKQNIQQAIEIIDILNNVIGIIPSEKSSGFESIAISFHERDIENVYYIVDYLIREGINVFIGSKKLYSMFNDKQHRHFDYLILAQKSSELSHLKYCIAVLNNTYIQKNLIDSSIDCIILKEALENDSQIQVVSFHKTLNIEKIRISSFQTWKPISVGSIENYLIAIVDGFFLINSNPIVSQNDYRNELEKIFSNFQIKELTDENNTGYCLYELIMDEFNNEVV